MATISEDFLNSLPAEKRDDFLKKMMEFLSMDPSKRDEIMEQNIRGWYQNHQGRVIKCNFCRKDEHEDQEFGQCARCGLAQYCSKACQKRHWKFHKIECLKWKDGDMTALNKKHGWRLDQFYYFYSPLIAKLVLDMYRLFNRDMNTSDIMFPEDVAIEIQLADLPQRAKRPRFYIEQVLVTKLTEDGLERAFTGASLPETGYDRVRYCLSYRFGPGENEKLSSYYQFQYQVSPAERSNFNRSSKELYGENVGEHQDFINSIAKGENPKIYKIIKQVLKEKNG